MNEIDDVIYEWMELVKAGTHKFMYKCNGCHYYSIKSLPPFTKPEEVMVYIEKIKN